ncbi:hypothetical protein ACHAW6_015987 [Cyclotella cf. meneghiniana]
MRFGARFVGTCASCCCLLSTLPAVSSFSYFSPQPHHNVPNDSFNDAYNGLDTQPDGYPHSHTPHALFQSDHEVLASKRRNFFSKVATASSAATVFSAAGASFASPANAVTTEPTRIELTVETDYLIRVLNYFDGDMRKVLGAIVRSPLTSVVIEPPKSGFGVASELSPKDAILRALYSYKNPEEYAAQSSWLKVDAPNPWIEFLTKKRYELDIPFVYAKEGEQKGSVKKIVIKPATTLSLSNIEAAVGLAALSYPVAYAYYNYESWQEEQEKLAKKRMMAAKKAKGKASEKGASKGTVKNGDKPVAVESGETKVAAKTAAMKGQASADAKAAKKPFPKRPLSPKEQAEATMVPNAMTEALNEFFGTKPGPTVAVVDVEPETVVKPPKYQKQQAELIDHLEFVENKPVSDPEPKMEQTQSQNQDTDSNQPETFPYISPTVPQKSNGGMDAYAAQMAQMTGTTNYAREQPQQQQQQSVPHNDEQPPPQTSQSLSALQPEQDNNSLRSLAQNVKKGKGGMDAYEAQMRAMMERNQGK